jgi:predicted aldo/keto reductase-like oxidoreductase
MYHDFKSENVVKTALVDRHPRDSFTLATKLHGEYIKTKKDRDKIFNEQMKKTGVDFFDYYLIHGIDEDLLEIYEKLDCFNWLLEKKKAGLVKHAGFSFHDTPELLDKILTEHPEMEFVQLQINYDDWNSKRVQARECYEVATRHGKDVFVMEPIQAGKLASVDKKIEQLFYSYDNKSPASWALSFVFDLNNVKMVLSGMNNLHDIDENIEFVQNFKKLNTTQHRILDKARDMLQNNNQIECRYCDYCKNKYPQHIPISLYFKIYNENRKSTDIKHDSYTQYKQISNENKKASECLKCGKCQEVCPQHLKIIMELEKVALLFEQ